MSSTMGLEVLQARLRANELEFAKLNGITLDAKPEVKAAPDVKKTEIKKTPGVKKADGGGKKMPGNNNPWAGELASRNKKKNSVGRQTSQQEAAEIEEDDGEWEWEEEEEEEVQDKPDEEATGKANITIDGSLVKIDRSKVDWSDDEFEEEEEEEKPKAAPAPPPPPPAPPAPPPPPPPPGLPPPKKAKSDRVEALKKRPTKRPDWNDLMQEIEKYRCKAGMLKKTVTNDRSKPMLSKSKVKGVFVYESEKNSKEADILKEISQGAKLKHVRCNDRSKPNLKGIKTFKRQLTKEEKDKKGFSFGDDGLDMDEMEDVSKIRDDLESTKQLLELEVRSKSLLEKDNKKLQAEIERLKEEFQKMQEGGQPAPEIMNSILSVRKDSVSKEGRRRKSSVATVVEVEEDNPTDEEKKTEKPAAPQKSEEVIEEMEELKEEVDEARKLAEEWEAKYKEMQRQMSLLEEGTPFGKKNSATGFEKPVLQRGVSTNSAEGATDDGTTDKRTSQNLSEMEVTAGDDWMQKREVQQVRAKLKNMKDKKEMIVRERFLLTERVDSLKDSIAIEYEARKKLKKDVKDMNAAFKEEMEDMELDEDANDLDDCYYENEDDLVINSHRKKKMDDDDMDEYAEFGEDDDLEESVEEIIKTAEESEEMEVDPGEDLFNKLKEEVVEVELEDMAHEKQLELLNKRVEEETEKVQTMRKSNFSVKAKIDILYDLLQTQKEKHYDLKQELNRMLSDIQ